MLRVSSCPRGRKHARRSQESRRAKFSTALSIGQPSLSPRENTILSQDLQSIAQQLNSGAYTATEVANACFTQIDRTTGMNAYISVLRDAALAKASAIDASKGKAQAKVGRLQGVPIAVKDNFCVSGTKTTAASKVLQSFVAPYDSTVTSRLEAEGAVLVGKTNMDEFGMGSASTYSAFGPVVSPWSVKANTKLSAGGSSGGSAAALAARTCFAAIGSDTGGSIRLPASWTGLVGLKPTYGLSSRFGLIQYASSLDTPAIFAKNVSDAQLLLDVIAGEDENDSTSVGPVSKTQLKSGPLTVGIPKEYHVKEMSGETIELWKAGIAHLKAQGHKIVDISLPHTQHALSAYYIIASAEASSNLSRYDGVRYGYRAEESGSIADLYTKTRTEAFGTEVQRRIIVGNFVLSRNSYESYYKKALQIRRLVSQDFDGAFGSVDVIFTPTTPTPALPLDEIAKADPVGLYINDVMTTPANMAGIPAVSVPVGLTASGLPVGLQLMAAKFNEANLLQAAKSLESIWTTRVEVV